MPRRAPSALIAVLLLVGPLAGCGSTSGSATAPAAAQGSGSSAAAVVPLSHPEEPRLPVTVTSADGRRVTIGADRRIVPLSGSLSELVFSLGLGGRVVARDVSTTFPQATGLPLLSTNHIISAESVLAEHPDVVLADSSTGTSNATAISQIRAAGVPVVTFADPRQLSDIDLRIAAVADALGVPQAGAALAQRTDTDLAAAQHGVRTGSAKPRVAFLYLRGTASVYLIGGEGSGAESLIAAAGGTDAGVAAGFKAPFTPITSEALAEAGPDAILVMSRGLASVGGVDGLLKIPGIAQTPAGQQRRIISVEDGELLSYGPRTPAVLQSIVAQLFAGQPAK
ncbi:heme/hemin ABC transporter substrate-binding protein [Catenulispora pinisilvae]|uniref:heme/hemin ABC transporter substrate-binding protein n=1 Tax=Catenulispora pinisilvae TaxID=2705253 RepID=UPI00189207A1|nr:ABC transporter substrate-binding protein [Catenulispora pinisilvae]